MNKVLLSPVALDQRRATETILRNASGVTEWTYVPAAHEMRPIAFVVCRSDGEFAEIASELESVDVSALRFRRLPRDAEGYIDVARLRAVACARAAGPFAVLDGGPLDLPADHPTTLVAALDRASRLTETRGMTFVDADGNVGSLSYKTLFDEARAFARTLAPLARGGYYQHAVICCADRLMFVRAFWACQLAGMTAIPCDTQAGASDPVHGLIGVLNTVGLAVVLQGERSAAGPDDPRLVGRCTILAIVAEGDPPGEAKVNLRPPKPTDLALLLSTSGSTGAAKLVMQSHDRLLGYAAGSIAAFGFGPDMVSLNWLPLTHVGGLVMYHIRDVLACCQQIIVDTDFILRRPRAWLELIDRYKVTNSWAPNFAYALVTEDVRQHPDLAIDLSSLTFLLNGGELIATTQATAFLAATERLGLKSTAMVPAWGMSETCSGVLYGSRAIPASGPVAVGKPLPGCAVRIVDESGTTAVWGRVGELQVKGRSVTGGYFRRPDANGESFSEDGWFRTGDLATIDEQGTTICGRIKDTLIVNGINFSAAEIERAAESAAEIEPTFSAAVAIRGEADTTDSVLLLVVPRAGTDPVLAIRAATRAIEGSIGIRPDWVHAVDRAEIPKTVLGKIRRQEIQRRWMDRLYGRAVEAAVDVPIHVQRWQAFQPAPRPKQANPLLFVNATSRSDLRVDDVQDVRVVEAPDTAGIGLADVVHGALDEIADDGTTIELMIAVEPASGAAAPVSHLACPLILQLRAVGDLLATLTATRRFLLTVLLCEVKGIDDLLWLEPIQALLRCLGAERRDIETRAIRMAPGANLSMVLRAAFSPHELALEGNRLATRVVGAPPARIEAKRVEYGRLFVVSGGLGDIGHRLCERLSDRHGARLIIMGRKIELSPVQQQRLEALRERTSVTYLGWSGTDRSSIALREAIVSHRPASGLGDFGGVFHLAGSLAYGPLDEQFDDRLAQAWEAKASVADVLVDVVRDYPACLTVFFSSLTAQFGGVNVGAHATANAYLDALSECANARGDAQVYSIDWSVWAEIGQSAGRTDPEIAMLRGFQPLAMDAGFAALDDILRRPPGNYMVGLAIDAPSIAWRAEAASVLPGVTGATAANTSPKGSEGSLAQSAPRTARGLLRKDTTQDDICTIWRSVLNLDRIDPDDSFFDLGGTSLLVPQVLEGIKTRFGVMLKAVDIFRYPTIATLSAHISRTMAGG